MSTGLFIFVDNKLKHTDPREKKLADVLDNTASCYYIFSPRNDNKSKTINVIRYSMHNIILYIIIVIYTYNMYMDLGRLI